MSVHPQYDYIVVGSGIAGLYTALLASEHGGTVLLVTKGSIEDCNTRWAQGGIAAAVGSEDSPELHMDDTLKAGAGLSDSAAAHILAHEGSRAIEDLMGLGVAFDRAHGGPALAREASHSLPRVLHAGGDATGAHIELTLATLTRTSRINVQEYTLVTRLMLDDEDGSVCGVAVMDARTRQTGEFLGRYLVLATGGAGRAFWFTTNPAVATGDGVALAMRAGAQVMDMEFYQFHPTALRLPGSPSFLISEAVRGEGGVLRNSRGHAFMCGYHPMADLAPRDVIARAIAQEMRETRVDHVLLDVTHLPSSQVTARFPTIYRFCEEQGLDLTRQPIPVAPAAHYMMGGVKVDTWGRTTIPGLYACGEVSCNGLHGANRLASNSLLETVVFGRRLLEHTLSSNGLRGESPQTLGPVGGEPEWELRRERSFVLGQVDSVGSATPHLSLVNLQRLMWENVGIVRDAPGLLLATQVLGMWDRIMESPINRVDYELANLVLIGRLIAESALFRCESRGAHYRTDFPDRSSEWEVHTTLRNDT